MIDRSTEREIYIFCFVFYCFQTLTLIIFHHGIHFVLILHMIVHTYSYISAISWLGKKTKIISSFVQFNIPDFWMKFGKVNDCSLPPAPFSKPLTGFSFPSASRTVSSKFSAKPLREFMYNSKRIHLSFIPHGCLLPSWQDSGAFLCQSFNSLQNPDRNPTFLRSIEQEVIAPKKVTAAWIQWPN